MFSAAAFVLFFLGCSVLAFVRNPMYGLGLYLATVYIHPPSRWWSYMLPDLRWTFIAGTVALAAVFVNSAKLESGNRSWFRTVPGIALLIFVLWFWLQNFWALYPNLHFQHSVQLTKYLIVFYFVYRLATGPKQTADILLMHVAGCAFLGLLCLYVGRNYGARLDGVGGPGMDDANTLGMYLATGVVVGAVLLLTLQGWRRNALLLMVPIALNGVFYTGSRGAFVGSGRRWCRRLLSEPTAASLAVLGLCGARHRSGCRPGRRQVHRAHDHYSLSCDVERGCGYQRA